MSTFLFQKWKIFSYIQKSETAITEWWSDIWNVLVDSGTVHRDGSVTFKFKNGKEITVQ